MTTHKYLYKILPTHPPDPLPTTLPLSDLDKADGFIHLSTASQVPRTAARFFENATTLWVLQIPVKGLGGELKWEGVTTDDGPDGWEGELFPHLYNGSLGSGNVLTWYMFNKGSEEGTGWIGTLGSLELIVDR